MFDLGPVAQYTLSKPPLAQALAQVRFPLLAKLQTFEGVAPLQEALSADFPYMDKVVETGLSIALGQAAPQSEQVTSWHFKDDDDRLVVVAPNMMTLSMGRQYVGFADFRRRFSACLAALESSLSPRRCLQVGVRFFNLIHDIGQDGNRWKEVFNSSIVGWPASQIVHGETNLLTAVSQIQLASPPVNELAGFPAEVQAVIRHGVAPGGSFAPGIPPVRFEDRGFFLDIDLYVATSQEFEISKILSQFDAMHSQIDRFFRWALTSDGEKYFGLVGKEGQ